MREALGDHVFERLTDAQSSEWDEFRKHVSSGSAIATSRFTNHEGTQQTLDEGGGLRTAPCLLRLTVAGWNFGFPAQPLLQSNARCVPRPVAVDLDVDADAQDCPHQDDDRQHHHAVQGRFDGDGLDDVSRHQKLEAEQKRATEECAQPVIRRFDLILAYQEVAHEEHDPESSPEGNDDHSGEVDGDTDGVDDLRFFHGLPRAGGIVFEPFSSLPRFIARSSRRKWCDFSA